MDSHINFENPGIYTVNVLEGEAQKRYDPRQINLEGTFSSPAEYVTKRRSSMNPQDCHVIFDYPNNSITLVENETEHFNCVVKGTLKPHPLLTDLAINSSKSYTAKELHDKLRFQARFFLDRNQHLALMRKLLHFSVKVTTELEKMDDRKGNTTAAKVVQLQGRGDNDLNLDFALNLEMIGGTQPETLYFSTELDVVNNEPRIYLLSDDYIEKFETLKEKMFAEQLPKFADFVTIVKK